ncbi:MAG: putative peptidoglycan glycosyltransferase FtsW [Candidatus Woesebacteria bacterium]
MNVRALNLTIFFLTIGFIAFGLLVIYDVSVVESFATFGDAYYFLRSQALWAAISVVGLIIVSKIPTKWWLSLGPILFGLAVLLLIGVLIPSIGVRVGGARRWLSIAGFSLQPAELMKMGLVLYLSTWLLKPRRFLSFALLIGLLFGLIMLQPDLGSGLILLSIAAGMYIGAGKPIKHLIWMFGAGIVGILLLILVSPYRMQRLTTFLNPESDPQGKSYHIRQITIALGNGGLFGQGIGKSKQKYRYIPEASTDSIFAIMAEELGFAVCGMIIIGYMTLVYRMSAKVEILEQGSAPQLLALGILTWIAAQILVNLSSVVALIPLTGVPLPFISYGGTALLSLCIAIGLFIGIPTTIGTTTPHKRLIHKIRRHSI